MKKPDSISIILPSKNEAKSLHALLAQLRKFHSEAEIIVVDDGSTDETAEICRTHAVKVVSNPYSMGNGAAIKNGARAATGEILVFMDADGQHSPDDIAPLLAKLNQGYDMVVGARSAKSQASVGRHIANNIYNQLSSWMVGHKVEDLTSGFRAARAGKFKEFLHMLPNGFSYPTTITMAFFRAGYPVAYIPIHASRREGKSHIKPLKDAVRFFLIIFRVGTLYSPLKIFLPVSLFHFFVGLGYYVYTYAVSSRFTNMSALLFSTAVIIFMIGLVSEQITNILYTNKDKS
jgi:glycosyltransferase involved in cell wall biosynthesis